MSLPGDSEGRASGGGTSANTKGTQVSIAGVGGIAVLDRGHPLCQEGTGEPRENGWLPPSVASPAGPLIILRTAMPGPHRSHTGAAGSCQSQQNFPLPAFRGCPGQRSWPGKLLTIPILNTSVMVYGP